MPGTTDLEMVMTHHNNRFRNKKAPTRYEFRGIQKNGTTIYLEVEVVGLQMKEQFIATRSYIWDITDRVQSARAVQESEERYRNLVENFLDIVLISDYEGKILYTNPAFEQQTGFSQNELATIEDKINLIPEDVENEMAAGAISPVRPLFYPCGHFATGAPARLPR